MKNFPNYAFNKISEPSWHIIPLMATLMFGVVAILLISKTWPVFSLIVILALLGVYWTKMYKNYKASKEKQDE